MLKNPLGIINGFEIQIWKQIDFWKNQGQGKD